MLKNKYIIKSLAPWMVDELIAFSRMTKFDLIFLRKQDEFYNESLELLKSNGVRIFEEPFKYNFLIRKVYILLKFSIMNIWRLGFDYNGVLGFKSALWFLKLDLTIFSKDSNLHAQFATQPTIVALLIKKFFFNVPPMSFTFHAYDIYGNNKWFELLIKNCHRAYSISNFNIDYVKKKYIDSDKIELSRLGVFRSSEPREVRQEKDVFTIGVISWFIEKKGIIYLLEALSEIHKTTDIKIKLKLAGDGPLKQGFLKYIDDNDLNSVVDYIGKIKGEEKSDFFNSIDGFVLPSIKLENDQDGIPVVLMEAISNSLPIISTNISGIPEICKHDYNGRLIEQRDVGQIVDSIIYLCQNKDKRTDYADNSYRLSREYDIIMNSKNKLKSLQWI